MKSPRAAPGPIRLSLLALLAGAIALGLAAIPPIAFGRPIALAAEEDPPAPPRAERQGGVTFKLGKFEVNVGGKQPDPKPLPAVGPLAHPIKWFLISAIAVALITVVGGAFAGHRDRHPVLAGTGMALGVLAIAWQYVIIGIAIGVTVAVLLILLHALS